MPIAAIQLYDIVLFVHVSAALAAFGVLFAYPAMALIAERGERRSLPYLYGVQSWLGSHVITPAMTVLLLAGLYLVADSDLWSFSEAWIGASFTIVIVLFGLEGAFFGPLGRRLVALARADVEAAGDGEVALSPEHERLALRAARVRQLVTLLALVALFLMVVKPGT